MLAKNVGSIVCLTTPNCIAVNHLFTNEEMFTAQAIYTQPLTAVIKIDGLLKGSILDGKL